MRAFSAMRRTLGKHAPASSQKSASASKTSKSVPALGPCSHTQDMTLTLILFPHVPDGRCQPAVLFDRFEALDALQQVEEGRFDFGQNSASCFGGSGRSTNMSAGCR